MGFTNGQFETSLTTGKGEKGDPGLPGIGFNLTDDGNFDIQDKRLTEVADPIDNGDAATKKYVDDHIISGSGVTKIYVDNENAKQDTAINSKAEKTDAILRDGTQSMSDNLNLNNQKIVDLADPTGPKGAATKGYVDNKVSDGISKVPNPDLSDYLKVNGSVSMTGDLNMGDNKITDLDTQDDVSITDYPNYVKDAKMAVNKVYVNENFLKLKGDDYDLKGKRILNTEPYYDGVFSTNDLVSKAYVDAEISKLPKPDLDVLK